MTRNAAIRRTLLRILVLNAAVAGIKLWVALRSGNLTVVGATLDSVLDTLNNVLAIVVIGLAARGPDEEHPYGHDKFETMGALAIVGFLSISCFELARGAVERLRAPVDAVPVSAELVGLLLLTAGVNVLVVVHERRQAKRLRSPLLLADAAHTMGDLAVTGLAIGSLAASQGGARWADPVLALLVVGIIGWSGWQILRVTVPVLVDERARDADGLRQTVSQVAGVTEVTQVRSRTTSSGTVFVELTITVDGTMTVAASHRVADAVEDAVSALVDGPADITVHVEPR